MRVPTSAETGEIVNCKITVTNEDAEPLTYVHCKCKWVLAKDEEGRDIIDEWEAEFDAWTYTNYDVSVGFRMPPLDVYIAAILYQQYDDTWEIVHATPFLLIDNPAYPPWWLEEFAGLKVYKWIIIGSIALGGAILVAFASSGS